MNTIFRATFDTLNHPFIKESIQHCASAYALATGLLQIYGEMHAAKLSEEDKKELKTRNQARASIVVLAEKVTYQAARLSLILGVVTNHHTVTLINWVGARMITKAPIYAASFTHPLHIARIVGCFLGIPATIQGTYRLGAYIWRKLLTKPNTVKQIDKNDAEASETNKKLNKIYQSEFATIYIAAINTGFSSPWLHELNRILFYLSRNDDMRIVAR